MSLTIEEETTVDFDFPYQELAKQVIDFTIEHEKFPYEVEVNLTLTDNEGIHQLADDEAAEHLIDKPELLDYQIRLS